MKRSSVAQDAAQVRYYSVPRLSPVYQNTIAPGKRRPLTQM